MKVGPEKQEQIEYEDVGLKWMPLLQFYRDSKYFFSACFAKIFSSVKSQEMRHMESIFEF